MSNELSAKIKLLRKEKGLTLEQVATIVGVEKSTVRKWETGMITSMKQDKIVNLAKALGTTVAYLMDTETEEEADAKLMPSLTEDTPIRRLQLAFKRSGMSQVQLASTTGITTSTISRYLLGECEPKATAMIKLASALNVSVEYLMGIEPDVPIDYSENADDDDQRADSREIFSANLRGLIGKTGKLRKDISSSIGVSYSTFSEWCTGKKYPRIEKIEALAKYFNVPVSELVGKSNSNQQSTTNPSDKDEVLGIILRLHTDRDFLDVVETISRLDCKKLSALQHFLEVFGELDDK